MARYDIVRDGNMSRVKTTTTTPSRREAKGDSPGFLLYVCTNSMCIEGPATARSLKAGFGRLDPR